MEYINFEEQLTTLIQNQFECSRGDAQGIVEAKEWEVIKYFDEGKTVEETYQMLFA
jgi:hypothetical protein